MACAEPTGLDIEVVYCPGPGQVDHVTLRLAPGATAADALQASGILQRHALDIASVRLGVWCKGRDAAMALRDRDRVEVYRALLVDPKEARRQRYAQHRARYGR